jgi:hypothetical protein
MYLVLFRNTFFGGYNCSKLETLGEAKEFAEQAFGNGYQDVVLTQEIPMKVTVTVTI